MREERLTNKAGAICCCCISKCMTRSISKPLHVYNHKTRLIAFEVGIYNFQMKYHNFLAISIFSNFWTPDYNCSSHTTGEALERTVESCLVLQSNRSSIPAFQLTVDRKNFAVKIILWSWPTAKIKHAKKTYTAMING